MYGADMLYTCARGLIVHHREWTQRQNIQYIQYNNNSNNKVVCHREPAQRMTVMTVDSSAVVDSKTE